MSMSERTARSGRMGLACFLVAMGAGGCEFFNMEPAAGGGEPLTTQEGWSFDAAPVIKAGDLRRRGVWNDPCVLREGQGYVMYLTSSTGEPFKPPVQPFRAVSADGKSWRLEPETPLLSPQGTEFVSIETPTVVRFKGAYHMYFTGVYPEGSVPSMAIGHATSPDGVTWTLDRSGQPVIRATGSVMDWNGFLVAEPGAVVRYDRLYLYFTAMGGRAGGNPPQVQVIALATSDDGTTFDEPRSVLGQSSLYPPTRGYVGYSTPSAVWHDGKVHLFYDVAHHDANANPQWAQVALHHAVSEDGASFQEDAAPILTRERLGFAKGEVLGPSAIIEGDSVNLWFQGHAGAGEFIGEFLLLGRTEKFGIRFGTIGKTQFGTPD